MNACSVIIVNYNTGDLLKQAVDAVVSNQQASEIIVVDNASTDNSMELFEESDRIKKYYRKNNHGFASSCNYGAKLATSGVLLFLNPDCIVENNSIDSLMGFFSGEKVAVVGVRVNNPNGTEQRATRRRLPTLLRAIKTFSGLEKLAHFCHCFAGVNLNHQPMPKTWQAVEAISGAFILMRAQIFDEINGFDESFPMHFEDLDLFKRIQDLGYEIIFNPNVSVIHHQGTSSRFNPKVAQMKRQGLQRYFYKHCSKLSYFLVRSLR